MTARIKKACEIVEWAIKNGRKIREACREFGVHSAWVRDVKHLSRKDEGHDALIALWSKYKFGDQSEANNTADQSKPDDEQNNFETNGKTASYEYKGSKMITSLEEAISFFKIDTTLWEIERYVCNSYPVSARKREQDLTWTKTPEGNQLMQGYSKRYDAWTTQVNYQVKVWLKKRVEVEASFNFEEFYKELLSKYQPYRYAPIKTPKNNSNNLLEVNIFDLHLGKLCWAEEVNNNYDVKIASERFRYSLNQLMRSAGLFKYERIIFPVGNDFFHSDNHMETTTAGTRVGGDSRWQKVFRVGVQLLVEATDYMSQFAPVDIIVIPGNHDRTKTFFLGETLASWYRSNADVTVDNSANPRKYYDWGKVLLGFTHGDQEKIEKLRSLMSEETGEKWVGKKYKEFHLGHQHRKLAVRHGVYSDMIKEELGIVVRSMASLSGTDTWHHSNGYVGPVRAAEAYLWNKEEGMLASLNSNIRLGDDK